ncbi:histone deacetylase domain protein, partial [Vibrio parahaemolyticus V-223/04]
AFLGVKL